MLSLGVLLSPLPLLLPSALLYEVLPAEAACQLLQKLQKLSSLLPDLLLLSL
jgi:hypothetical protein